jgi:hypothetical protein
MSLTCVNHGVQVEGRFTGSHFVVVLVELKLVRSWVVALLLSHKHSCIDLN